MPEGDMTASEQGFGSKFIAALESGLAEATFAPLAGLVDSGVKERLARFSFLLLEANREANLTRIIDPGEMAVKHVLDSMTALLAGEWPHGATVCDVGTGGGLPGIVLAVVRPDLSVTLVDSVAKKVAAVESIARALGIGAQAIHARAEELGREAAHRERYQIVVARAVAPLPVLAELCLPLVAVGGSFVAMKGRDAGLEEGFYAVERLGGKVRQSISLSLPGGYGERTLLSIAKVKPCPPEFPRRPGMPEKRPLVAPSGRKAPS